MNRFADGDHLDQIARAGAYTGAAADAEVRVDDGNVVLEFDGSGRADTRATAIAKAAIAATFVASGNGRRR